jgi:hypothetical protein
MNDDMFYELPIRSKREMAQDIAEIIQCLHRGQRSQSDLLIEDLKARCTLLDKTIQQDVLIFAEQVQFQYVYDPWHRVTPEVQIAADRLIEDLGFFSAQKKCP